MKRLTRSRLWQFLKLVWRMDDYFHQPASRWTVGEAWFTAGVIADACRRIRLGLP